MNIAKILKNYPKGIELYNTVYGKVFFIRIVPGSNYPIRVRVDETDEIVLFTYRGRLQEGKGECTLFPSKTQRDWNKFELFDTIPINTPIMINDNITDVWTLSYYAGNGEVFKSSKRNFDKNINTFKPKYIVPIKEFNFEGTYEENVKKSII